MDTLSEIFISAVLKVNPSVSVKPKTRPSLIVTGSCCLMTVLVTYYYLWISVGLTGNTLPLLPLTPVYLLVGLELVSVALLGWTLTGYRVSSGVSCLLLMFLPFQLEYLITMHLHRHMGF